MIITTGGAKSDTDYSDPNRRTYPTAGDQLQKATPDYKGEVRLTRYNTEADFRSTYAIKNTYEIVRPISLSDASGIAQCMITACNNPNIGYLYGGKGMACQGGSNRVNTTTPCVTDCSGLVSECVTEATGVKVNAWTGELTAKLKATGKFMYIGIFSDYATTPVYNGDVLVKVPKGHTEIVVSGNPREGTEDEILTGPEISMNYTGDSMYSGLTANVASLRSGFLTEWEFKPRRNEPLSVDPNYSKYYSKDYGETANGSYAWGRFSEICRSECDLSRGQPRRWFINGEDGYTRGVSPALGAVMCFTNIYDKSDPGYVCIVEYVGPDYIYISHRNLKGGKFEYVKRTRSNSSWDLDLDKDGKYEYKFQGFIYNPSVNTDYREESHVVEFVRTASEQQGKGSSFTKQYGGVDTTTTGWSAGFVRAVAAKVGGLLGVIIPDTASSSSIGILGTQLNMGEWLDGPVLGSRPVPQAGDIAIFRTQDRPEGSSKYLADKCGIVVDVTNQGAQSSSGYIKYTISIAMGDCAGKVQAKQYTNASQSLLGLFRPYWDRVDGVTTVQDKRVYVYGMYTEPALADDAAIREVHYLNKSSSGYKPSIQKSGIKLCAINYTGMLANLYGAFAEMTEYLDRRETQQNYVPVDGYPLSYASFTDMSLYTTYNQSNSTTVLENGGGSITVTSQGRTRTITADSNFQLIYSEIYKRINNRAGTVGIMANIFQESGFCSSAGNSSGHLGLCQWGGGRATNMKNHCISFNGQSWEQNVVGQIDFIYLELSTTSSYKSSFNQCLSVPNTLAGAYLASDTFVENFERPGNLDFEKPLRRGWAEGIWTLLFGDNQLHLQLQTLDANSENKTEASLANLGSLGALLGM